MLALCVAAVMSLPVMPPQGAPAKPPTLPKNVSDFDRTLYDEVAGLLADSKFDEAKVKASKWDAPATAKVYFEWVAVPSAMRKPYRSSAEDAIKVWNEALGRTTTFQIANSDEDADLVVVFERDVLTGVRPQIQACSDFSFADPTAGRKGTARIALNIPFSDIPHTPRSIEHLFAKSLGAYLGLVPTDPPDQIMGRDPHLDSVAIAPTKAEADTARQLQLVRRELAEDARRKITLSVPQARAVFDTTKQDAGDVWRGDVAHFTFKVKNVGKGTLEISAQPTCGCTIAKFDKAIEPGATGSIEADLKTEAYHSAIQKGIDVTTNDPAQPHVALFISANVKSGINVSPSENPIVSINDSGSTEEELELEVVDGSDIQRVVCGWVYVAPKLELEPGKPHTYKLTLDIGPDAPAGRNAFTTTLYTNSKRMPTMNITTVTEKGIVVSPPSVFLGMINSSKQVPITQMVSIGRRVGAFHLTKIECDDPKLSVSQQTLKDGQDYRLLVSYNGGWTAGTVQRKIVVETDDPKQPKIEIMVMASVTSGK